MSGADTRLRVALSQIAAEEIPEGLDLWPALAGRRSASHIRQVPRHRHAVLVVVLLVALLAIGTTVLAAGGDMLQRFGMLLLSPAAVARLAGPTPTPAAGMSAPQPVGEARALPVNRPLEAVQREVAFPLRTPAWLPKGVVFRGAMADPDGAGGGVSYAAADGSTGGFGLQMRRGRQEGGYAVPTSATQEVQVHGRPAVYAQGAWNKSSQWQPTADAGLLSWEEDGFTFVLTHSGVGLSQEDVLRIAESLR